MRTTQWLLMDIQNRWHPDGNSDCYVTFQGRGLIELL